MLGTQKNDGHPRILIGHPLDNGQGPRVQRRAFDQNHVRLVMIGDQSQVLDTPFLAGHNAGKVVPLKMFAKAFERLRTR